MYQFISIYLPVEDFLVEFIIVLLMYVNFTFFTFIVSSMFRNLSKVLIWEIIHRVFFPFHINAKFNCQPVHFISKRVRNEFEKSSKWIRKQIRNEFEKIRKEFEKNSKIIRSKFEKSSKIISKEFKNSSKWIRRVEK